MALAVPAGSRCFIDANILYYHFVETPPLSDVCSDFLQRVLDGEIVGVTSTHLLSEAIHKIMIAEAAQRHAVQRAGLVGWLQRDPQRVSGLTGYQGAAAALLRMNVHVLTVETDLLLDAVGVCREAGLLMNDATSVAMMRREGIIDLATNDDDFDRVAGVRVWKPR